MFQYGGAVRLIGGWVKGAIGGVHASESYTSEDKFANVTGEDGRGAPLLLRAVSELDCLIVRKLFAAGVIGKWPTATALLGALGISTSLLWLTVASSGPPDLLPRLLTTLRDCWVS